MPAQTSIRPSRTVAVAATALCLLAATAAVTAFLNGHWLGVVWVLLAGVTSNMAWYHWRRLRAASTAAEAGED